MLLRVYLLIVILAPAGRVSADTRFTLQAEHALNRAGESRKGERQTEAWAGDAGARLEDGEIGWIYQAAAKRLLLLGHADKTYQVFPLPFSMVDFQPEAYREQFRESLRALAPQTRLEGPGAAETVEGHSARRYLATITLASWGSFEIETWISPDLGERCALLERLLHARTALNPLYGDAQRQILELPGCAVRQIVRQKSDGDEIITDERLVTLRDEPAEPGRYAPPAGYREVPLDPKVVGGFLAAQPLPSP